jgi:tetratricopeptide (TPR) repeat protein
VKRGIFVVAAIVMTAGCKAPLPRPAAASSSLSVDELAAAVAEDARRSDLTSDSTVRAQLAADAAASAQACLDRAPDAGACLYSKAIALGLEAQAHPLHAGDTLKMMLDVLGRAEAADPDYDEAGPARVRALVLIKAPGWPLGPGDPDSGLAAARRAVSLRPEYPPNVLALADALAKTGDTRSAKETYLRAQSMIEAMPPSSDRDAWRRQADQALGRAAH